MKLSNTINDGIIQTLDRLCGSSVVTYPFKNKITDLNDSLDSYFKIAFQADGQWAFDDINNSSPAIDTQTITSGTNRYKIGTFTEKIINLIKLEVLDSTGLGHELIAEDFSNLSDTFQKLYLDTTVTGIPQWYCKYGDFIYLRPFPNYTLALALKAYFNRPASKFEFVSCQPEADDDLITAAGHGLVAGDTVIFEADTGGALPAILTADTQFYVIASGLTTSVFRVATTLGGSTVNIATDGTGVTFLKTSKEPGIPSIHHLYLARKAALAYMNYTGSQKLGFLPQQVLLDEKEITTYFGNRNKDEHKIITFKQRAYK